LYPIADGIEGGLERKGFWQDFKEGIGWSNVRELTEFEKKALKYLREFSPIDTEIRL
jgi:hypothetical protein